MTLFESNGVCYLTRWFTCHQIRGMNRDPLILRSICLDLYPYLRMSRRIPSVYVFMVPL